MACHHKVYELVCGSDLHMQEEVCQYEATSDGSYSMLLQALNSYGTLGNDGPRVTMKLKALQILYPKYRQTPRPILRGRCHEGDAQY
jgi:hypothetical protein